MMSNVFWPIFGGFLIGASAFLLLLSMGRIAGIAGILWGAVTGQSDDKTWRWLFILGLLLGGLLFQFVSSQEAPQVNHHAGLALLSGLIVGIGVRIGNGCTSGHGVCGIGRLSGRSFVATLVFMTVAVITVAISSFLLGGVS